MLTANHAQRFGCLFTVLLGLACATTVRGQCETQVVVPSDGAVGDQFGAAVDVSGDTMIVGSPVHNGTVGAAYVYVRQNGQWIEQAKLTDGQVNPGDDLGRAVSVSGNFAAMGAAKNNLGGTSTAKGRVFMFARTGSTWALETLTTPPGIPASSEFGTSVSVDGDAVLVGVPFSDDVSNPPDFFGNSGSAYIFRRDAGAANWVQEAKLVADDGEELDQFGSTVLLRGNTAFVTSFNDKDTNISANNTIGSVYVFTRQGMNWIQSQKLVPSDAAAQAALGPRNFGRSLGSDGSTLIVGERSGQSAYVFRFNGTTWVEETILKKPAGNTAGDQFGNSVAINGDVAMVGAPLDDDNASNSGTIFVYRRIGETWTEQPLFYGSAPVSNGRLGSSLASRGTYAVAGAIHPASTGNATILAVQAVPDCDGDSVQDECQLRANPGADANQNGILDACECQNDAECNDNVACTNNVCNTTIGQCEFPVQAGFCFTGGMCHTDGTTNPANECQVCDSTANGTGWSNKPDDVTVCAPDTNECTMDVCQNGVCAHPPEPPDKTCGSQNSTVCDLPDTCSGDGMCLNNFAPASTSCADALACNGGDERCNGMGACVPTTPVPCIGNPVQNLCTEPDGFCTQCLTVADCPDDGNACTVEACNIGIGLCTSSNLPAGTGCGDPTVTDCDLADTCNSQGVCQPNVRPNNTLCTSDGNACNGTERCQVGNCVSNNANPCAANPTAPNCVADPVVPDDFTCATCTNDNQCNDNNACTADTCTAGACLFTPHPMGTNCGPVDQTINVCNLQDTCNGQGACLPNLAPNGTACPDADLCNGTETCVTGVCTDGPDPCNAPLVCDPADGSCKCTTSAQCSDGLFCNGSEVCNIPNGETEGVCGPAADTTPCNTPTIPICDEATDSCRCSTNEHCSDGAFCTGTEACVNGACQASGNPCTSLGLACNEAADRCDCDDNGDCNQTLFCAPQVCTAGQCVAGPARCPAGQQCDERNDRCATCLSSDDPICNDSNSCTLDTCPAGQCVHTPIVGCNDADRDGVLNNNDDCPGTSPGAVVDANGCADFQRDSDDDGVNDDVDDCPGTPAAERDEVDRNGCADSQIDSDGDGIADAEDDCPDSPEGEGVDDNGCADAERDDDADGVLNGDDRCADTPAEEVVDIEGCSASQRDLDGDGVFDDVDECAGTAVGAEVDEVGCPINDNGNNNGNGNDNGNDNGNEPGQEVPDDGMGLCGSCGAAGFIGWFSLFSGFVALRLSRRRLR